MECMECLFLTVMSYDRYLAIFYILTLVGNLLIVTLVSYSKNLHTPMYFFLTQLSLSDIMLTTDITPNLLYILLHKGGTIDFSNCFFQFYIFVMTECTECLLLTVMSYDRYLAICNPLHYINIMNELLCKKLASLSWLLGIGSMMIGAVTVAGLDFCGPNIIDHFFCDVTSLIKLSCSDTFLVQLEMVLLSVPFIFFPFLFIMISYVFVIFTILKIPSNTGKKKAFSTCSSHLMVVSIFYITLIVIYDLPTSGQSLTVSKLMALLYTVGTPLINPIIYSLRNKDMKIAFSKLRNNILNL
ncbi:olfactory receptor 2G3-like [Mantella aurantiaca]